MTPEEASQRIESISAYILHEAQDKDKTALERVLNKRHKATFVAAALLLSLKFNTEQRNTIVGTLQYHDLPMGLEFKTSMQDEIEFVKIVKEKVVAFKQREMLLKSNLPSKLGSGLEVLKKSRAVPPPLKIARPKNRQK